MLRIGEAIQDYMRYLIPCPTGGVALDPVEPDGDVRFFQDIYDDDASLKKVLAAGYPFPLESLNPSAARVEDGD